MESNSDNSNNKQLINLINENNSNDVTVYPFIDELVDSLFNDDLNNLIEKNTEINSDKSVFMMFVNIYFMAYLHTTQTQNRVSNEEKKHTLKKMLSEVMKNPEKRQVCVSLIKQFNPLFNIDSVISIGNDKNKKNNNEHFLKN
jgi:hypothetical protein